MDDRDGNKSGDYQEYPNTGQQNPDIQDETEP